MQAIYSAAVLNGLCRYVRVPAGALRRRSLGRYDERRKNTTAADQLTVQSQQLSYNGSPVGKFRTCPQQSRIYQQCCTVN